MQIRLAGLKEFPGTLAEMQSYDAIFISNLAAGDLGTDRQRAAGKRGARLRRGAGMRGRRPDLRRGRLSRHPLETTLPVSMELDSKKVLPSGAVVLIMHGMEFNNGNQVARDCAQGVLAALGPHGRNGRAALGRRRALAFPAAKGRRQDRAWRRQIAGMNQGDLGSFQNIIEMAHDALNKSKANLKHIIVFSDGDPGAPSRPADAGDRQRQDHRQHRADLGPCRARTP